MPLQPMPCQATRNGSIVFSSLFLSSLVNQVRLDVSREPEHQLLNHHCEPRSNAPAYDKHSPSDVLLRSCSAKDAALIFAERARGDCRTNRAASIWWGGKSTVASKRDLDRRSPPAVVRRVRLWANYLTWKLMIMAAPAGRLRSQ